jgi:hypothetical protein
MYVSVSVKKNLSLKHRILQRVTSCTTLASWGAPGLDDAWVGQAGAGRAAGKDPVLVYTDRFQPHLRR